MNKDEALKQALEALECIPTSGSMLGTYAESKRIEALTILRGALAQPDHPEQMARLGWQYVECPACGSEGARAFPKPAQWTPEDMAYRPGGLAQPEQEPVAWSTDIEFDDDTEIILPEEKGRLGTAGMTIPLYTSPPKREWVGLTEWEREAIAVECGAMSADWLVFVEAVEKALKEKNT